MAEVKGADHKPLQSEANMRFWEAKGIWPKREVRTTSGKTYNLFAEENLEIYVGLIFPSAISKADFWNAHTYHCFHSVSMSSAGKMCYSLSWLVTTKSHGSLTASSIICLILNINQITQGKNWTVLTLTVCAILFSPACTFVDITALPKVIDKTVVAR